MAPDYYRLSRKEQANGSLKRQQAAVEAYAEPGKLATALDFTWSLFKACVFLTIVLNAAGVIVWILIGCP